MLDGDQALKPPMPRLLSRRNLRSSMVLVSETVIRLGLVALVSFWIARAFGPEQFGLLNFASALVMVFWTAALLGLDTPLVARLTRSAEPGASLGSAIVLRVIAGVLGAAAALVAVRLTRGDDELLMSLTAIVALSIPLSAPYVLDGWFKVRNEPVWPASARLIGTLLGLAAKVAVLVLGLNLVALAWTVAIETLLISAGLLWAYIAARASTGAQRLSFSKVEFKHHALVCWPYLISTSIMAVYMKIDVVLLGVLSSDHQTGVFSLSQKLTEVTFLLPVVVVEVLFPHLVRHHDGGGGATDATMQTFFDFTMAVALASIVLSTALVWLFLPTLFGEAYRPTTHIFLVHVWGALGMALAHARLKWMAAAGHESLAPVVTLIGLAIAVCLHLVLFPRYGAVGAALATSVAYLSSGILASFAFRQLWPAGRMQLKALWPWGRLLREMRLA